MFGFRSHAPRTADAPARKTPDQTKPTQSAGSQAPGKAAAETASEGAPAATAGEIGGPTGPEPTRFGDWEHKGRCIDF